jgi:hypothetical protein
MLLLVLFSLALLAALVVPLAMLSSVTALESARQANALRHRFAVDSVLATLPQLLAKEARLGRDLDRGNRTLLAFELGELQVEVLLQDDTAKLPLALLSEQRGNQPVQAALARLQASLPQPLAPLRVLPVATASPVSPPPPAWTGCLEDLFAQPDDHAVYGRPRSPAAWVQFLSPLGKTVNVYRADAAVLDAVLADLQVGLGTELVQARQKQTKPDLNQLLDGLELPESAQRAARQRLVATSERYSLLVRTQIGDDVQQHYVLCTAASPPQVLINWEIAP